MSSHSFEEVERTCDRAGIIRQGELVAIENMRDLRQKRRKVFLLEFDSPASAASFAGSGGFNILEVNENIVKLSILGNASGLIKALEGYNVLDLNTETSSLEDIFMHYYGDTAKTMASV